MPVININYYYVEDDVQDDVAKGHINNNNYWNIFIRLMYISIVQLMHEHSSMVVTK